MNDNSALEENNITTSESETSENKPITLALDIVKPAKRGRPKKQLRIGSGRSKNTSVSDSDGSIDLINIQGNENKGGRPKKRYSVGSGRASELSNDSTDMTTLEDMILMPPPITTKKVSVDLANDSSICVDPIISIVVDKLNSTPAPFIRRSLRVITTPKRYDPATGKFIQVPSISPSTPKKPKSIANKFTSHCHISTYHTSFGCGALSVDHLPGYFDLRNADFYSDSEVEMVVCEYCGAWLFPSQYTRSLDPKLRGCQKCCCRGRSKELITKFHDLQMQPRLLMNLKTYIDKSFKGTTEDAEYRLSKKFFDHIKLYNNEFSFGTMSVKAKEDVGWGIQKINGLISYNMGGPIPPHGKLMRHGQVYTLDTEEAMQIRLQRNATLNNKLDPALLLALHTMLVECHPHAKVFKTVGDLMREVIAEAGESMLPNVCLQIVSVNQALKEGADLDKRIDRRKVETPDGKMIGSVWIDDGCNDPPETGVIVRGIQGDMQELNYWDGRIDTLLFPLILPYGQTTFHLGIPIDASPDKDPTTIYGAQPEVLAADDGDDTGIDIEELPDIAKPKNVRRFISQRQFYRFMFCVRGVTPLDFHWLWSSGGSLIQTLILSVGNRIKRSEYDYIKRYIQKDFRTALPKAFIDALEKHISNPKSGWPLGSRLGKVFIAPAYIKDSRRAYQKSYADFMSICRAFGNPDLFLTITANPDWPEIQAMLRPGQTWMDRPDVVVTVFEEKVQKQLLPLLLEKNVLGPIAAYCGAFEHQNRSMVHLHLCLIFQKKDNNVFNKKNWRPMELSPEAYCSEYIQSEIPAYPADNDPDKVEKLRYRNLVIDHHIHVCHERCVDNPKKKCRFRFPRPFSINNVVPDNAYPLYKRRPPAPTSEALVEYPHLYGELCEKYYRKQKTIYDNSRVVPHNRFLLLAMGSHCNLEYVCGDKCCEYTLEYITKGCSMAFVKATRSDSRQDGNATIVDYDQFQEIHMVKMETAQEVYRNIMSYPVTLKSHSVKALQIHLPEQAPLAFDGENVDVVAEKVSEGKSERQTMLTAFLELVEQDKTAGRYKYPEINRHYHFDLKAKAWIKRKIADSGTLIRIWSCTPRNIELSSLRSLLLNCIGSRMLDIWKDKREKNITFLTAAEKEGLVEADLIWHNALIAFTGEKHPRWKIIDFFALVLINGQPKNPINLVDAFQTYFFNDKFSWYEEKLQDFLRILENCLRRHGVNTDESGQTCCEQFGLPKPAYYTEKSEGDAVKSYYFSKYIEDEDDAEDGFPIEGRKTSWDSFYQKNLPKLNTEQISAFNKIKEAVENESKEGRLHFLYGEGGTGKTFLYQVIIAWCKANEHRVITTASTGIAATLLFGGRTVHSTFFVPNDVNSSMQPRLGRSTVTAAILREAELIIVDEISCLNNVVIDYVDRLLRFIFEGTSKSSIPFAGKVVIFGGDWKQILPVHPGGDYHQFMASVKNLPLFERFTVHKLIKNMRLLPDQVRYRKFCLDIGTGSNFMKDSSKLVIVPDNILLESEQELIDFTFDHPEDGDKPMKNPLAYGEFLSDRVILSPHNNICRDLNKIILEKLPGDFTILFSTNKIRFNEDSTDDILAVNAANFQMERIEQRTPQGFPPHNLELKLGAILMVTRNISLAAGLVNGTRLQLIGINIDLLTCRLMTGSKKGQIVYIPKIRFIYGKSLEERGVPFERIQFPVTPAFAITVNKSQGQTIAGRLGFALQDSQCFSHGQAYVGFSRVTAANCIRVLSRNGELRGLIENVVCQEILDEDERPKIVGQITSPQKIFEPTNSTVDTLEQLKDLYDKVVVPAVTELFNEKVPLIETTAFAIDFDLSLVPASEKLLLTPPDNFLSIDEQQLMDLYYNVVNPAVTRLFKQKVTLTVSSTFIDNLEFDQPVVSAEEKQQVLLTPSSHFSDLSLTTPNSNTRKRKPIRPILYDTAKKSANVIETISNSPIKNPVRRNLDSSPTTSRCPLIQNEIMEVDQISMSEDPPLDFTQINFATSINRACKIYKFVSFALNHEITNTGNIQLMVKFHFNNIDEWLDDRFVLAYLCMLAQISSSRKVVVVDPVATNEQYHHFADFDLGNATYNYERGVRADVYLLPLFLESHWVLLVHDINLGTFVADSIARPGRLSQAKLQHIMTVLSDISDGHIGGINIQVLPRHLCSQQGDGNSCGYFVGLFAEQYLTDKTFLFKNFDKNREKRRMLWHINQLYSTDNVNYKPINN